MGKARKEVILDRGLEHYVPLINLFAILGEKGSDPRKGIETTLSMALLLHSQPGGKGMNPRKGIETIPLTPLPSAYFRVRKEVILGRGLKLITQHWHNFIHCVRKDVILERGLKRIFERGGLGMLGFIRK